jgi:hypothetical protein
MTTNIPAWQASRRSSAYSTGENDGSVSVPIEALKTGVVKEVVPEASAVPPLELAYQSIVCPPATVAAVNATAAEDGTKGSLVKISLKDAAGNAAGLDSSGGIKVTVNGAAKVSAINGTEVTDVAAYTLGANDFNGSGNAWINVINGTAETVALTLSGTGSATGFTSPGSTTLVFKLAVGEAVAKTVAAATSTTKTNTITTVRYVTAGASTSAALKTGNVSATLLDTVTITDTSGKVTGCSNSVTACAYDMVVAGDDTALATDPGSFSVSAAFTAAAQSWSYKLNGGATVNMTLAFPPKPPSSISIVAVLSFLMKTKMLFLDLVEETNKNFDYKEVAWARINEKGDLFDLRLQKNPHLDPNTIVSLYRKENGSNS